MALRLLIEPPAGDIRTYEFLTSSRFWEYDPLRRILLLHTYAATAMTFGLLWLPAIYACLYAPLPLFLKRSLWFVPLVVSTFLFGPANMQRALFLTFPVVIPLAVLGLYQWTSASNRSRLLPQ